MALKILLLIAAVVIAVRLVIDHRDPDGRA